MEQSPISWRQELLIINFFVPLEEAMTQYFQHMYGDPAINVKITHKMILDDGGGFKLNLVLSIGEYQILGTDASYSEQQIADLKNQTKLDLQKALAFTLAQVSEQMYVGLNKVFYKNYKDIKTKPTENVTVDSKIQAHNTGREEIHEKTGDSTVSSS